MPEEQSIEPYQTLVADSLNLHANYIETGNPVLSAKDAEAMKRPVKALGTEGMEKVLRLRMLAKQYSDRVSDVKTLNTQEMLMMKEIKRRLVEIQETLANRQGSNYAECESMVRSFPQTWYPGLLTAMVNGAIAKHVFKPGRVHVFVKNVEDQCAEKSEKEPPLPKPPPYTGAKQY